MKKYILVWLLLGMASELVAQSNAVGYDNTETFQYSTSYRSSSHTYLMWDRNDNGDGHFVDSTSPNFFYWDNDIDELHYLIDTGNMDQLKAAFKTLDVAGTVNAREVIVSESTGADFVFEEGYNLPTLADIEKYIGAHKHLPEIPSAEEMKRDGVKVGALQMKLLQKIEELTLYVIEQQKRLEKYRKESISRDLVIERLREQIEELQ